MPPYALALDLHYFRFAQDRLRLGKTNLENFVFALFFARLALSLHKNKGGPDGKC